MVYLEVKPINRKRTEQEKDFTKGLFVGQRGQDKLHERRRVMKQ